MLAFELVVLKRDPSASQFMCANFAGVRTVFRNFKSRLKRLSALPAILLNNVVELLRVFSFVTWPVKKYEVAPTVVSSVLIPVVNIETFWNRSAMSHPHDAMKETSRFCVS